jgi:hypothetical protein
LARRRIERDRVVDGVEDLDAEPDRHEAEIDDRAEVARVDAAAGVALTAHRIGVERGELGAFVRRDAAADAPRADVGAAAHGEGARRRGGPRAQI